MIADTGSEFGGLIGLIAGLNVQRDVRATQSELMKALQWMVNNWKRDGNKPPDHHQQPPL